MQTTGAINEKGYLDGFTRRGYNAPKCVLELAANSLDALDPIQRSNTFKPKILYSIKADTTSQIDNGTGMECLTILS